ncbi:FHA domain-containing protein [Yoonia vestfoldensis]|uniref:Inner membrane component of T3SS, cytoplasmic domain n=1 Tax=Yoonia vestfoldensis TaxID=245188 RepID=A0A1Y0EFT6_9RHOB|nr:FHA domain-containing protein [Yoonia vestfoldensis]ARU02269.1 inner membrane component of T3SS, cytoplasmic domain [Yoonia vestfoldensis]
MKFIRDLIGKKRSEAQSAAPADDMVAAPLPDPIDPRLRGGTLPPEVDAMLSKVNAKSRPAETPPPATPASAAPGAGPVNIWDIDTDDGSTALPEMAPIAPKPARARVSGAAALSPARSRRTKTRLIGFDKSDGSVVDLFNDAPKVVATQRARFPVGWIVVIDGPGRGESFALMAGMNAIGRGEDQAVQLDFGDNAISRSNHAAIVYDTESKDFLLGHGGKSNIVRLNDRPVISNETLTSGDVIRIGETVLRFVALCDGSFSWAKGATGEDEDVAIA